MWEKAKILIIYTGIYCKKRNTVKVNLVNKTKKNFSSRRVKKTIINFFFI